ncbi:ABC transporter permease [Schwartzia sp. (in: firmicutes)]
MNNKVNTSFLSCLAGFVIILICWEIFALIVNLPIIPHPVKVFQKLYMIFGTMISVHLLQSLYRILTGLVCAVLIGVPLGICIGYFPRIERLCSPLVYLLYPVPKVALLPIVMLLFGTGDVSKVLIIFAIIIFQIVLSIRDSIHEISEELYYPLKSLGASFKDIFFDILWPASLPRLLTALRISTATSISVLFFTETFGTKYGLGYFIMDAWLRVNYLEMYAGIIVLSLLGLTVFCIFDLLEKMFCSWK